MKKADYEVTTYELGKNWMLDIVKSKDIFESWIYRKDIGIKSMMFGVSTKEETFESFLNMSVDQFPDYADDYAYDYL